MSKASPDSKKEPKEVSEELGLKDRALLGLVKYGIDTTAPKLVDVVKDALKSPDTKGLEYLLQGLQFFGQAGIQFLEDAKSKQVQEEQLRLEKEAKEKELSQKRERFEELRLFLTLTQEVISDSNKNVKDQKTSEPIETLREEDLTLKERQIRQQKTEQEQKKRELVKAIKEKYLYKQEVTNKQKFTILGANLRKWWVDKDLPIDTEGHPDLRWVEEVATMQELASLLVGANLHSFNLSGMNLENLKFFCTTLTGANLSNAHITGAQVINTDMRGANLSDVICYIKIEDNPNTKQPIYLKLNGERLEAYLYEHGTLIDKAVFSAGQPLIRTEGTPDRDYENPLIAPFLLEQSRVKFYLPIEHVIQCLSNPVEDYSPSTNESVKNIPPTPLILPIPTKIEKREDAPPESLPQNGFVANLEKEREKKEEKKMEQPTTKENPSNTPNSFVDKTAKKPDLVDKFISIFQ